MGEPSPAEPPDWRAGRDDDSAPVISAPVIDEPDRRAEPSWAAVLATTLRLWLERRGLRRPASSARGTGPRWRRFALAGLVLMIFAAGALTVALAGNTTAIAPAGATIPAPGLRAAAAVRGAAATWIARQVSRGAIVACDPVMCSALQARGFPAGSLLILGSSAADPLGSAVVVATAAVRSQLGSRLTSEYAPVVLASFGSGAARVEVMVTAADGAAAYRRGLQADLQARRVAGRQLLHNTHIGAAGPARAELAAGRVDARLLITLAVLAAQDRVRILAFGGGGPGAGPGVPLRTAELASPAGLSAGRYLQSVLAFLGAQRAPYLAASMAIASLASGRKVLHVGFAAPSPLGLLGARPPAVRRRPGQSGHRARPGREKHPGHGK
jgi:hypothetical protein